MVVRPFELADAFLWDEFCEQAYNATFLHTRAFLAYHGDRFKDRSLLVHNNNDQLIALLPAAESLDEPEVVVSHPGITYGGFIHQGKTRGQEIIDLFSTANAHYLSLGYEKLRYKVLPSIYHRRPAQDDVYVLFRMGARRYRCDLSCAIDLQMPLNPNKKRQQGMKRAINAGVSINQGASLTEKFWHLLGSNLQTKHGAQATHTLDEISLLQEQFPAYITTVLATLHGEAVAGIVIFVCNNVAHVQYMASSDEGNKVNALDAVIMHSIKESHSLGYRWFDFGISNEQQGRVLNAGLYDYKYRFGGGGVVHEFFELDISSER